MFLFLNSQENIIKEIDRIFYNFIWNGPAKIKKNVLIKEYIEGGLKMINISAFIRALKITWIRRLILNDGKWSSIIQNDISLKYLINSGSSYILNIMKTVSNPFWLDVLKSLHTLTKAKNYNNMNDVLRTPVFFNEDILIGRKPIFFTNWYKMESLL